ncbi:MAG TPA: hypothetical protein VKV73_14635 [Chloroflexota bacterium]|nr:hypothetical protein [Chloroflexota bacterium]
MASKRPAFSFPELEPRGRGAILRSAAEVRAEEARLAAANAGSVEPHQPAAARPNQPRPAARRRRAAAQEPAPTQATNQSSSPSVSRPLSRPIDRLGDRIVDRPKAFYITERLDQRLDEAVRYFQLHHGLRKVDRSTLVNALLGDDALWTDTALDQLTDRLIRQLTSRLTR